MTKRSQKKQRRLRNENAPKAWLRGGAGFHDATRYTKRDRRGNRIRPEDVVDMDSKEEVE